MKTNTAAVKQMPEYTYFQEADGWHYSESSIDYLDARGTAYKSKAAAKRAAKEDWERKQSLLG